MFRSLLPLACPKQHKRGALAWLLLLLPLLTKPHLLDAINIDTSVGACSSRNPAPQTPKVLRQQQLEKTKDAANTDKYLGPYRAFLETNPRSIASYAGSAATPTKTTKRAQPVNNGFPSMQRSTGAPCIEPCHEFFALCDAPVGSSQPQQQSVQVNGSKT